jgi:transposase
MLIRFARTSELNVRSRILPTRPDVRRSSAGLKAIYREHNLVESFFSPLKQFRRIITSYDNLGAPFFTFIQLASARILLQ